MGRWVEGISTWLDSHGPWIVMVFVLLVLIAAAMWLGGRR
jgi:uncharacterized membrane protein YdjX (TVP38/TMEM64 family)